MKKLKRFIISLALVFSPSSFGDLFGGDVAVLMQILTENIKQLIELENIVRNSKDNLSLLREINRGINDSLRLVRTISQHVDPGMYGELKKVEDVLRKFESIYGVVVESPSAQAQRNVDRAIAEAVTLNNSIYDYTKEIDKIGEEIKSFSHAVSPGGATKLTAQSMGVMLHVLNQQLRAQGTLLKLQAQGMAAENKKEKEQTAEYLGSARSISKAMKDANPQFQRPRF